MDNRKVITVFTRAHNSSVARDEGINFTSYRPTLKLNIIIFSNVSFVPPNDHPFLPLIFPTKKLYIHFLLPRLANSFLLNLLAPELFF
jgi:hypothetical protein